MVAAVCAAALAILCWDHVGYILEWRDVPTSVRTQRLYRTFDDCKQDQRRLLRALDPQRVQMGACDNEVWLPWEQNQGHRDGPPVWGMLP